MLNGLTFFSLCDDITVHHCISSFWHLPHFTPPSSSFHLYTSSPTFPSLNHHIPLSPLFFTPHLSHVEIFTLQGFAFQMGLDDRVTSAVSPVYLPCPGISSTQETSGLTRSGAWNSFRRGCHPCTLDKEGSHCRGGSIHLNMNEAYSQGVFTPRR